MTTRVEVWIAPEGYVPAGRLIDPEAAEFWVVWQDDALLQDDVVHGAAAAVGWGKERSDVVMIRLGHSEGSYFSAGERHPADDEGVPHWPPAGPPPEGWWSRPAVPTLEDVTAKRVSVGRGELSRAEAVAWAGEQLAIFDPGFGERDLPTLRALVDLKG